MNNYSIQQQLLLNNLNFTITTACRPKSSEQKLDNTYNYAIYPKAQLVYFITRCSLLTKTIVIAIVFRKLILDLFYYLESMCFHTVPQSLRAELSVEHSYHMCCNSVCTYKSDI